MNRSWIVVLCLVAVVAGGTIWFVVQQQGAPDNIAPLPEKSSLEAEADELQVAIKGRGGKVMQLDYSQEGWKVFGETEAESTELEELLEQVLDLFQGIDRAKVSIGEAGFLVRTNELKDPYGNTLKELPIVDVKVSGATFSRIDWQGFDPKNFERVADHFWIHEEIKRMAEEKKQKQSGAGGGGSEAGGGGSSSSGDDG